MKSFALALAAALLAPAASEAQLVAVLGGTVIDGKGGPAVENAAIIIADGRIACLGRIGECPAVAEAEAVNASGRFIVPALVDAHVHLMQTGWLDGRPDGLPAPQIYPYTDTVEDLRKNPRRWPKAYLCAGITAAFDAGGMPWTVEAAHQENARADGVRMRAAGPLITHAAPEVLNLPGSPTFLPMGTKEEAEASVARVAAMGADAVKVWYLEPKEEDRARLDANLMAIGAAAKKAGLALFVHATGLREAKLALKAGAATLVHSVFEQPVDDEFISLLKKNDATYVPTLIVYDRWTRALASVVLETPAALDDPNRCVDDDLADMIGDRKTLEKLKRLLPKDRGAEWVFDRLNDDGRVDAVAAANLKRVYEAGGRIAVGTDAGNPLTLHGASIYAEMEAMQKAGVPAAAIVEMATRNGAVVMGDADDYGTIEPGKRADLIFLKEDPRASASAFRTVTHVMRDGVVKTQEELRRR